MLQETLRSLLKTEVDLGVDLVRPPSRCSCGKLLPSRRIHCR